MSAGTKPVYIALAGLQTELCQSMFSTLRQATLENMQSQKDATRHAARYIHTFFVLLRETIERKETTHDMVIRILNKDEFRLYLGGCHLLSPEVCEHALEFWDPEKKYRPLEQIFSTLVTV